MAVQIPMSLIIASLALSGTGIAAYVDVISDIKVVENSQEKEEDRNKERYEQIQEQLRSIEEFLRENRSD